MQNTDKQSHFFWASAGSLNQTLWKQDITNNVKNQHINLQQNIKYLNTQLRILFCKSYQKPRDFKSKKPRDFKSKKNLRNKNMFRYTSGISQILLKPHLSFPSNQSSSNVVQINNETLVKLRFSQDKRN